ncbi:hypothetical protein CTAYLR_007280 [Chrysophaeum taylorii]|uniref:Plastid lipid-associated protein/fibrillin conserved domain-containing protein n=1 Tax=Chrysophaeum taylorii TaxID=2483200 RepID=A0AAD7XRW0_9STRA|nr:hypothetical protein CTAYLR_007280 [Chrysophaeum taylorii]
MLKVTWSFAFFATALDVELGDGSVVAFECSSVACTMSFCERHRIMEAECAWELVKRSGDMDELAELSIAELAPDPAAVDRFARRSRELREAAPTELRVRQPHWRLAFTGATGTQVATSLREWGLLYAPLLRARGQMTSLRRRRRRRLAFVSSWFCNSAIGRLAGGIIEQLDRARFEVVVAHVRVRGKVRRDFYTDDIEGWADAVVSLPSDLGEARHALEAEAFEGIVYADIGMEPFSYALAFARLAPLQMAFWGHPTTSGIPDALDYYLLMDAAEPDLEAGVRYSEQLVRLDTMGAFYRKNESGQLRGWTRDRFQAASPALRDLVSNSTIYACPQHCLKYHPEFDEAIVGILSADPRAVVVVRNCSALVGRLEHLARDNNRLVRVPTLPLGEYVQLFGGAHVALEPFPFGGSITTLDAFEAGTPVVAREPGPSKRPGLTRALYEILGMRDCCLAPDTRGYVELAVNIANDPSRRAAIRARLDARRGLLFENLAALAELEAFFDRALRFVLPNDDARPASSLHRFSASSPSLDSTSLKGELLRLADEANMGRDLAMRETVKAQIEALEAINPTQRPNESDLLTATWRLVYTTSDSILGTKRIRPLRPRPRVLQSIDAKHLKAKNEEWVLLGLLKNSVVADLEPRDDGRTVDVQFKRFGIGWLRIPAPKSARGFLETTFLDDDLRISRGDRRNLFVLVRSGPPRI